jgi:hypothetical protein
MGLRDLPYKPKLLGKKYKGREVIPSASYYYDEYAYKVVFDDSEFTNWRQRVHFKRQLEDFSWDLKIYEIRPYIASNGMRLYVKHAKDLDVVLGMFHSQITELHGPVNRDHIDVLTSADQYLIMRKTLLYKKYDCKFYIPGVRRYSSYNGSILGYPRWKVDDVERAEQTEFWIENLQDYKTIGSFYTSHQLDRYFYTTYEEFCNLLPYFRLSYPDGRIILHKVMLI